MANNTYNIKMLRQDFYSLQHDLTPKKVMLSVDFITGQAGIYD